MSRSSLIAVVGVALALGTGACGDDDPVAPDAAPASTGPTTSARSSQGAQLPSDPTAPLRPGLYHHQGTGTTFTVPEPPVGEQWYGSADAKSWMVRRAKDPCDGCEAGHVAVQLVSGSVEDAVGEWSNAAGAALSPAKPVTLGGASGVELEGSVSPTSGVTIVHGGYNPIGNVRVLILSTPKGTCVVAVDQYRSDEPFRTAGDALVASVVLDG